MRYLSFILLLVSINVHASEWYVGGGLGSSETNYDVNEDIHESIVENGNENVVNGLAFLGYPLRISSEFKDVSHRLIIGRHISEMWDIELLFEDLGKYTADAKLKVDDNFTILNQDIGINASVRAKASIDIKIVSLGLIKRWNDETNDLVLYNRIGLSQAVGTIHSSSTKEYSYSITGDINEAVNEKSNRTTRKVLREYTIHVGIGLKYNLDEQYSVRVEYLRYGNPVNGIIIDNATVDLLYNF